MSKINLEKMILNFDEYVSNCNELQPEERVADFLESIGFIEKENGVYQLTELGEKFLKLPLD